MDEYPGDYVRGPYVEHVSHYYGDIVRQLLIGTAGVMLIGAPFYSDSLATELPFEIGGVLVLAALAAFANPHKKSASFAAAIAAGVGVVIFQTWALYGYQSNALVPFLIRELIAALFLASFYFSLKTVRAFVLHQVGHHDEAGEFEGTPHSEDARAENS